MIENVNSVNNVDMFNDIVSRLEEGSYFTNKDNVDNQDNNVYDVKDLYTPEYRSKVEMLADNLVGVKPIDNQINNVIYLSDFMEKGIAIKSSIDSFKQIWVEYRLVANENVISDEDINAISLDSNVENIVDTDKEKEVNLGIDFDSDNLDDNYKKLYSKVININKYVDDFNKKKLELDRQIANLEDRKRELSNEIEELEIAKKEFERYKMEEQQKINNVRSEVNSKVVSLQNLIDNLDDILGRVN